MKIDLRNLDVGSGKLSDQHEIRFEDAFGDEAVVLCNVSIDSQQTGGACYLNATLHGEFRTRCHQCLEDVEVPVDGGFVAVIRRSSHHEKRRSGGPTRYGHTRTRSIATRRWLAQPLGVVLGSSDTIRSMARGEGMRPIRALKPREGQGARAS